MVAYVLAVETRLRLTIRTMTAEIYLIRGDDGGIFDRKAMRLCSKETKEVRCTKDGRSERIRKQTKSTCT